MVAERAAARLPAGRSLHLTFVGDGPVRPVLERYATARHLDSGPLTVELAGRLSHDAVRDAMAHADVFVAPAHREAFGIAALEARTAGLPVLAYTDSGVRSFIDSGVGGLLARDDKQMVEHLTLLATDDDIREQIAEHNRSTEPAQSWPHVLDAADRAYAQAALLAENAVPPALGWSP
jgi:glycosyltransferase involved in cell wall biosynthesis